MILFNHCRYVEKFTQETKYNFNSMNFNPMLNYYFRKMILSGTEFVILLKVHC